MFGQGFFFEYFFDAFFLLHILIGKLLEPLSFECPAFLVVLDKIDGLMVKVKDGLLIDGFPIDGLM